MTPNSLRRFALAWALLGLGTVDAHVVPLDVTLSRQPHGVQALIRNPDGVGMSGVQLVYRLGEEGALIHFQEVSPGLYRSSRQPDIRPPGPVTLIDQTFPGEESTVRLTTSWPPSGPLLARIPARPLTSGPLRLGPALLVPAGVAVAAAVALGAALRRSSRRGAAL